MTANGVSKVADDLSMTTTTMTMTMTTTMMMMMTTTTTMVVVVVVVALVDDGCWIVVIDDDDGGGVEQIRPHILALNDTRNVGGGLFVHSSETPRRCPSPSPSGWLMREAFLGGCTGQCGRRCCEPD